MRPPKPVRKSLRRRPKDFYQQALRSPSSLLDPEVIPLEVFENVVKEICIFDLLNFLLVSKSVTHAFERTKYCTPLERFRWDGLCGLYRKLRQFPESRTQWSVGNMLEAYIDQRCHHCGEFGYYFLWASDPPMKLCLRCLLYVPEYNHLSLREGLAHYRVTKKEIASYPILEEEPEIGSNKPGIPIILRRTLITLAAQKGLVIGIDDYTSRRYHDEFHRPFAGCIKVSGMDIKTGRILRSLICGHCEWIKDEELEWFQKRFSANLAQEIPHSIEALQEHLRQKHPPLLDYCIKGWESLPDSLQKKWFTGIPKYSIGCRSVCLVGYGPRTWTSWGEFAYDDIGQEKGKHRPKEPLKTLVLGEIEHEGSLFGLPPIPQGFQKHSDKGLVLRDGLEKGIADQLVNEYRRCANVKAEEWLRRKIAKEGIGALRSILKGDIFQIVGEESDTDEETERSSEEVSSVSSEHASSASDESV